jgi:hypothetical protein
VTINAGYASYFALEVRSRAIKPIVIADLANSVPPIAAKIQKCLSAGGLTVAEKEEGREFGRKGKMRRKQ